MVWKVSKIVCVIGLIGAILCAPVQAATHEIYGRGLMSTTYLDYLKDMLSGADFNADYVAFRSESTSYTLIVGDLEYENGEFTNVGECKEYKFYTDGTNANYFKLDNKALSEFSLVPNGLVIYSNLGEYPELVERGAKYEMFTALLICIFMLCIVVGRFFRRR